MRSGNPALGESTFKNLPALGASGTMTISGTVNKTFLLLLLVALAAGFTWNHLGTPDAYGFIPGLGTWVTVPSIAGFVLALVIIFKKTTAPYLAPAYAVLEGIAIGAISLAMEVQFPGIVIQAVGLTFGTLFCLLAAYRSGVIRATENFKLGVFAATGAVALYYIVAMVLSFFGFTAPLIHDSGMWGILFSAAVVVIAALNLVLDFDFIEQGEAAGAPKYMEWYGGFGLVVTLVWLYLEILRLLAKTRSRD